MGYVREQMGSGGGSAPQDGALDKLKKLGELKAAGVITEAEFKKKKAQLLEEA